MEKKKRVSILFVGDQGVGKTTLISKILSDLFPASVQKMLQPIMIPGEMSPFAQQADTFLVDSSSNPENEEDTGEKIKEANVINLIYDASHPESWKRVEEVWLPRIKHLNESAPILIVGNKTDLLPGSQLNGEEQKKFIDGLVKKFPQIDIGIQCSAKLYRDLTDLVYCSQRAFFYPIFPLYDHPNEKLKPAYQIALTRIFRICDTDHDNYLNDAEIKSFQSKIFSSDITEEDINAIKEVLLEECEGYRSEDKERGLNLDSFISLNKLLLLKQKIQACWMILRRFAYNNSLTISDEYLEENFISVSSEKNVTAIELSPIGIDFLSNLWNTFIDKEHTDMYEIDQKIFSTMTGGIPFIAIELTPLKDGRISYDDWISIWQMLFYSDWRKAFLYVVYLGYEGTLANFITIHKTKGWSLFGSAKRNVIGCLLCGKSDDIVERFVGPCQEPKEDSKGPQRVVVLRVEYLKATYNIVFLKYSEENIKRMLSKKAKSQFFDVIGVVHDGIIDLQSYLKKKNFPHVPILAINGVPNQAPASEKAENKKLEEIYGVGPDAILSLYDESVSFQKLATKVVQLYLKPEIGGGKSEPEEGIGGKILVYGLIGSLVIGAGLGILYFVKNKWKN